MQEGTSMGSVVDELLPASLIKKRELLRKSASGAAAGTATDRTDRAGGRADRACATGATGRCRDHARVVICKRGRRCHHRSGPLP